MMQQMVPSLLDFGRVVITETKRWQKYAPAIFLLFTYRSLSHVSWMRNISNLCNSLVKALLNLGVMIAKLH